MQKLLYISILALCLLPHSMKGQEAAAPNWAAKVQKALLAVTTYDQQGEMLKTGTAFYTTPDGEAIADYEIFKGAYSAIVTDQSGQKSKVERILGADDTYSLVRFKVSGIKKATCVTRAVNPPTNDAMVFILKYQTDKIKSCPSARINETKTLTDECPYYTLTYAIDATYLGTPVFNSQGELIGTTQPSVGLNGYALGAAFIDNLSIKAITTKLGALTLDNIHIAKGLPDSAEESLVYLYIKSQTMGNDEYLDLLNLFVSTYPDNAEGYNRRAALMVDLHRFDDADRDLQTYLRLSDDKALAYSKMADIIYTKLLYQPTPEYDKWTYDLAISYIDKSVEQQPENIDYKLLKAQILMSKHDYAEALDVFNEINAGPHRSAATLYAASLAHEGLDGDLAVQTALIDSAIATFPDPLPAEAATYVLRRGQLNAAAEKYREAVSDYNQYCFLMGQKVNASFYYDRAKLEVEARMYQQSLDDLDKAISLAPNAVAVYIEKCGLLLRVNQLDECIQTARQALALDPSNVDAYRIMGYAQVQQGNKEAGRQNLEKAVSLGDETAKQIIEKYLK